MPKLSDTTYSSVKKILIYGPPKSGKTQLVGNLASKGFILDWFDLENGGETLKKLPVSAQENINVFRIPDSRANPMAIETMLKVIRGGKMDICWEHGKVLCPICKVKSPKNFDIFDSSLLIGNAKRIMVMDSSSQLFDSTSHNVTRNKPDDYKLERDDWGNISKILATYYSQVQAVPWNIICISHETPVEMNDGKEKLVPVGGSSSTSRNFAKYFSDVVYMYVENKKHKAASATTYANNILTGSRTGVELEKETEIDLAKFFSCV